MSSAVARHAVVADRSSALPYTPESRDALALGLPDQVGGMPLLPVSVTEIEAEDEYATDVRVRQILVAGGYSPSRVTIEQKSAAMPATDDGHERIPPVALAAVKVKGVLAERFTEWDPAFYMLLTSMDVEEYRWQGEKPGRNHAAVAERDVSVADFGRF